MPNSFLVVVLALGLSLTPTVARAQDPGTDDPWLYLDAVRATLEASPTSAAFTQSFRPSGFDAEDRESGLLYLGLPACVRWDYQIPFSKGFLLCQETIWMWNEGESTGRRHSLRVSDQPGLDLMTLQIELLRHRYHARITAQQGERVDIHLVPLSPEAELKSATVTIDTSRNMPITIGYDDRQGNHTRFELSDYAPIEPGSRFDPPAELEWLEN